MKLNRLFGAVLALILATSAAAQTYPLFGPANGVLKGNSSTPLTTAATNPDIISLWSGTCNSGTYLNGAGTCTTPTGTSSGANPTASVGLTAVNGSAGTFLRSDGAPALDQTIAPTWTGLHKFTGNTTAGQLQFGVAGTWSAPALNIGALNYDVTGHVLTLSAVSSGATSTVNINASNSGTDQNIASFTNTGISTSKAVAINNNTLTVTGTGAIGGDSIVTGAVGGSVQQTIKNTAAGTGNAAVLSLVNDASHQALFEILSSTNSSGEQAIINSSAGNKLTFQVAATTQCQMGLSASPSTASIKCVGPSNATLTDLSPDTGTFTATLATGCSTTPTATFVWARIGNIVTLAMSTLTCTGSTTGFTFTGLPTQIQPTRTQAISSNVCEDATTVGTACAVQVTNSGTITMLKAGIAAGWTASGTKGIATTMTINYILN